MQDDDLVRLNTVRTKAEKWADALIDFGPTNTLLHYKDRKGTTLDLTDADPGQRGQLLGGRKTRLSALLTGDDLARGCIRARNLRRKMVELEEEQGIEAGRLAVGMLDLPAPPVRGTTPVPALRAPLLLQTVEITVRTQAETDYSVETTGEPEINPVLLYALNRQHGIDLDPDKLQDRLSATTEELPEAPKQAAQLFEVLRDLAARQGLQATFLDRVVVGLFSFDKMPMVADLRGSAELLASHDAIAAAAGYLPAAQALRDEAQQYQVAGTDDIAPAEEYLVLPADSSQQRASSAVLAGQHVVIEGPPGTGKSQCIANIIAASAAAGKRALFVAEKRAAIEAVTDRLARVDLDHLVFDLHQRKVNRRRVAEQVADSLERAGNELPAPVNGLHGRLARHRQGLRQHADMLWLRREPWQVNIYEVYNALLDLPASSRSALHFQQRQLRDLSGERVNHVLDDIVEFVGLDGLKVRRGESPWSGCQARHSDEVRPVLATLDDLAAGSWQHTQSQMHELVGRAGLGPQNTVTGWEHTIDLIAQVSDSIDRYGEDIFAAPLEQWCYAAGNRAWRSRHPQQLGWWRRRSLRGRARAARRAGRCDRATLHQELCGMLAQREQWRAEAVLGGEPAAVAGLGEVTQAFTAATRKLTALALSAQIERPRELPAEEISDKLSKLLDDKRTLHRIPTINRITDRLTAMGLEPLLDELARRDADVATAKDVFRHAWYRSLLDEFLLQLPDLANFSGAHHDQQVTEFQHLDEQHFRLNRQRVRRQVAQRLQATRDANPTQNTIVLNQARLKRRHMPVRRLVESAPDVLLAARPCWAMSPIVVSRLLPAQRLFDVVIFDEASQIEPHDAMASIMRGKQLVVAGDERQLPPNNLFHRTFSGDDSDDTDELASVTPAVGDYESILTCLGAHIPNPRMLTWHYRSMDDRLIAFSNHEVYRDALVAFPGRDVVSPLHAEIVDGLARPGNGGVSAEESQRVVDLVLDHARNRTDQTLGLITTGVKQANALDVALRAAAQSHPELAEFEAKVQCDGARLFVKSIEQVQGDERDVIIFAVGRSKGADGRLRMNFGQINQEGGERRLNVAVTRARRSMHVVSAFTHHDMPPDWPARGPALLLRFLELAASQGSRVEDLGRAQGAELNGFERSILDSLRANEVPVTPQWGVSGYRIDFALGHPDQPGRMVLAVEADGDSYHRAASVRDRDRLRQGHLEQLGWRFVRVWASEWFDDPKGQTARIIDRWKDAVASADQAPQFRPPQPDPMAKAATNAPERGPCPVTVHQNAGVDMYPQHDLERLFRWLMSDQLLLDRETRLQQAMGALGFRRRGKKIITRLTEALDAVQPIRHAGGA